MNNPSQATPQHPGRLHNVFAIVAGLFLGLALVKFGNPAIFETKITVPKTFEQLRFDPWPFSWAYLASIPILILAVVCWIKGPRKKLAVPTWFLLLPIVWLLWQCISATQSVSPPLTVATLKHFFSCVAWFYAGVFVLSVVPRPSLLFVGLIIGFVLVLKQGFYQHFTWQSQREYFFSIDWNNPPPEVRDRFTAEEIERFKSTDFWKKKLESSRISGTLFYPNTLAAVILLLLPMNLMVIWRWTHAMRPALRWLAVAVIAVSALICLYWSGSKSGWLLMLLLIALGMLHLGISRRVKMMFVVCLLVLGSVGFFVKYSGFFQKGATSVVARAEYWKAAVRIFVANPVLGSGPGTFSVEHSKIKNPDAEMARLTHNDYLEQASDSGVVGFATYLAFFSAFFVILYRKSAENAVFRTIWLGLLVVSLHGFVEFNLYIPAVAWPTFALMGYLVGVYKTDGQGSWS